MRKEIIRILSNLPRSGGTLIGRCLACMDKVVLLSEIHPHGTAIHSQNNPLAQAYHWHNLLSPAEIGDRALNFEESIELIQNKCAERGFYLVIRDWAYIDFMGVPYNDRPAYRSLLVDALARDFDPLQAVIVRHPVDQWLSIAKGRLLKHHLSLEAYLKGCRVYAEYAVANGFLRYEDFTRAPEVEMESVCDRLRVPYDPGFIDKWPDYQNITGDRFSGSASFRQREIVPPKTPVIERTLAARFQSNGDYRKTLELLGYPDNISESQIV